MARGRQRPANVFGRAAADGRQEIRVKGASFGLHFEKSNPAGTYSSGAFRFATAMSQS